MSKSMRVTFIARILCLIAVMPMTSGCLETRFGGMTASEVFSDPKVAALVEAASRGDMAETDALIKQGADVNAVGAQGFTPLVWVLGTRNERGVERLLMAGANPNKTGLGGGDESAMSLATGGNYPALLELLLKHGGNPNLMGPDHRYLLQIAALHDRRENLRLLLRHGADINVHGVGGYTAAVVAAGQGNFDEVAYLLEQGFNYDLQGLAESVEIRSVPPDSEQQRWKDKVIEMLKARGAKFPAFIPRKG